MQVSDSFLRLNTRSMSIVIASGSVLANSPLSNVTGEVMNRIRRPLAPINSIKYLRKCVNLRAVLEPILVLALLVPFPTPQILIKSGESI